MGGFGPPTFGGFVDQINRTNEDLIEAALNDTPLRDRGDISPGEMNNFLDRLVKNFMARQVQDFPRLCDETRRVNYLHNQELEKHGNRSKLMFTSAGVSGNTPGWSKDGTFKHKWIVPKQLEFFMQNLIYLDFWKDENAKVRDSFMKAILRGDEPMDLLRKVRTYYGTNASPISKEEIEVKRSVS